MDISVFELDGKSGIYCIENTTNNKKYVGSSKNILHRLYSHRAYLRKNTHHNSKLQNSWNKHGESSFVCYVLEFCEQNILLQREQYYIDTIKPWYNITTEVQELHISDESKIKMSESRLRGFKNGTVKLYQEKPIYQYTLDGQFIAGFKSIKEAAAITGVTRSSINRFLEGKYKKGGNYLWSLTEVESLPPYKKAPKDNSFLNQPIEVYDIVNNSASIFESATIFSKHINKNINAIRHAMKLNYPYLKRYMIKKVCRSSE